jgi:heme o synthase
VVLAVLAGQLFVGWSNDYLDRDRDRAAGRTDKPLAAGEVDARTVAVAALAALAATVPLSLASGVVATAVHLVAIASATAYNVGLKPTPLSPLPYAISFGLLPAFVTLGLPHPHLPPIWVMAAAALIGVGGHFAQARPDVEIDRHQRLFGLPQRLGGRASGMAAAVGLAVAAVIVAAAARNPIPLVVALPAAAVAVAPPRIAFLFTLAAAALTAVLFVAVAGPALR